MGICKPTRRERARAATLEEIKQTALDLIREQGSVEFRFTDIARAMGLTAPALYRYYAQRNELITDLVADSFDSLADAILTARQSTTDLGERFLVTCGAYRQWAADNPHRFALIFGTPVPGYAAPFDGPTTEAARRAMGTLASLIVEVRAAGALHAPLVGGASAELAEFAESKLGELSGQISADTYQAMVCTWTSLHGFVSLETHGHFAWMGEAVRDELFRAQMRAAALLIGLDLPA